MIARDLKRVKNNGKGVLIAAAIAFTFLCKWMDLMKIMWPQYMQLKSDYNLHEIMHIACFTIPNHIINYTIGNLLLCVVYFGKL